MIRRSRSGNRRMAAATERRTAPSATTCSGSTPGTSSASSASVAAAHQVFQVKEGHARRADDEAAYRVPDQRHVTANNRRENVITVDVAVEGFARYVLLERWHKRQQRRCRENRLGIRRQRNTGL